jgi:hypothetical protein
MPPGSTLILGAVIVTVMSWECSLSPSSVIEGGEVSQLMLAGRDRGTAGAISHQRQRGPDGICQDPAIG